jgi:hypothetical protein
MIAYQVCGIASLTNVPGSRDHPYSAPAVTAGALLLGTSLTRGQVNAVLAAFKAGVTPSRIARRFGLSQADVKKALAFNNAKR